MEFLELAKLAGPLLAIGGAWGGAKVALNGTRDRVKQIDRKLEDHIKDETTQDLKIHERVASIETKIDVLLERK